MPKRKQSATEKQKEAFKTCVKKNMAIAGFDWPKDVAPYINDMCRQMFCKKLNKPETFGVDELRKLYRILRFTPEEMLILFQEGDKL